MKKEFPCIEQTLEFNLGEDNFRLWIDSFDVNDDLTYDYLKEIDKFSKTGKHTNVDVLKFIAKLPKINAVQMRRQVKGIKRGVVIYTVEFNEDPHG